MAILLLAEHSNTTLGGATAKALSAASQIGGDVHILVAGHNCAAAAAAAAKLKGVSKVLVADQAHLANSVAEDVAAVIMSLMATMMWRWHRQRRRAKTSCRVLQHCST
jgi:electron transfer flavoprotein alpha subunit